MREGEGTFLGEGEGGVTRGNRKGKERGAKQRARVEVERKRKQDWRARWNVDKGRESEDS